MSKILFTISYEINPAKRAVYKTLTKELRSAFVEQGVTYNVYEAEERTNHFTEVYFADSVERLEALEESYSDATRDLLSRISSECVRGKQAMATLIAAE